MFRNEHVDWYWYRWFQIIRRLDEWNTCVYESRCEICSRASSRMSSMNVLFLFLSFSAVMWRQGQRTFDTIIAREDELSDSVVGPRSIQILMIRLIKPQWYLNKRGCWGMTWCNIQSSRRGSTECEDYNEYWIHMMRQGKLTLRSFMSAVRTRDIRLVVLSKVIDILWLYCCANRAETSTVDDWRLCDISHV